MDEVDTTGMMSQQQQMPALDMVSLRRLVAIDARRKEIAEEDKRLSAERTGLQESLLTQFEQSGMENARVDGRTVYVRVQLWARAKEGMGAALAKMLRAHSLTSDLVGESINTSRLSSHFRERVDWLLDNYPGTIQTREEILEQIKNEYQGTLELTDQITLQSRSS